MKLNRNGKLARLYCWTFGKTKEEIPTNFCPYFWKLVVALFLFPITWTTFPWGFTGYVNVGGNPWKERYDKTNQMRLNYEKRTNMVYKRFFTALPLYAAFIGLAFLISLLLSVEFNIIAILWVIAYIVAGVIALALAILLIAAIWNGVGWTKRKVRNSEIYTETKSIIKEKKNSFMENHCPKIDWVDK